jgi:phosphate uptake regulator
MAYALKGAIIAEYVHYWMIMADISIVTLDELYEMVLNMGQHVDQVLAKEYSSSSSDFVSVKSEREADYKLDNMTSQLESLSTTLFSSQSPNGS